VSSSAFHSQQPTQQQTQYPSQNRPAVQNNKATIIGSRAISRQSFISFAPAPSTQKVTQPATALSSPSSTSTPASSATTNTGTQTNTTATSNSISNATNTTNTTNSNTTKTLAKTSTIKNHIQAEVIKPAKSLTLEAAMAINAQARRDKKATVLAATPKQKTHFGLSQIGDLLTGATWLQTPRSLTAKKQAELSLKASELKLKQIPANIQRLDVLGAKQVSQHAYAVIKNFDYSSSIAPRLAAKQSQQSQQTQGTLLDSVSLNKLGLKQAQAHNSYLKHRALYKTPAQHSSKVLLELAAREKFASSQFVINGYFDNLFPATDKGARFYLKKPNQDWQLLTSQTVDLNGNFSYINKKKLADGSYELLVEIESLDGLSSYSKVFEIVIDSSLPKLDPVMPLIKVANTVVENFYKMPRQALTLQLEKLMPNLQLVVNLQSVLYSSVAVTSSSNSQLSFELPQLAEFQPGSHHKLTVYAASLEDPDLKSEPVVLEFQIEASFVQKVMAVIDKVIDTMSF